MGGYSIPGAPPPEFWEDPAFWLGRGARAVRDRLLEERESPLPPKEFGAPPGDPSLSRGYQQIIAGYDTPDARIPVVVPRGPLRPTLPEDQIPPEPPGRAIDATAQAPTTPPAPPDLGYAARQDQAARGVLSRAYTPAPPDQTYLAPAVPGVSSEGALFSGAGTLADFEGRARLRRLQNEIAAEDLASEQIAEGRSPTARIARARRTQLDADRLLPYGERSQIRATFGRGPLEGAEIGSEAVGDRPIGGPTIGEVAPLKLQSQFLTGGRGGGIEGARARLGLEAADRLKQAKGMLDAALKTGQIKQDEYDTAIRNLTRFESLQYQMEQGKDVSGAFRPMTAEEMLYGSLYGGLGEEAGSEGERAIGRRPAGR